MTDIHMAELRLDVPVDDLAVLDAYVQADSKRSRARRINPLAQDSNRSEYGA
jgi:hypothetical protein